MSTKVVWPILCVVAACGSSPKREPDAAPSAIPQPAPPPLSQSVPQIQNDPSPQRDQEGPIGVLNSSGRSGAFYVPGGSGLNALPVLVILHGTGQSGSDMIATFRELAKAHRFAIVAPESRDNSGWEV